MGKRSAPRCASWRAALIRPCSWRAATINRVSGGRGSQSPLRAVGEQAVEQALALGPLPALDERHAAAIGGAQAADGGLERPARCLQGGAPVARVGGGTGGLGALEVAPAAERAPAGGGDGEHQQQQDEELQPGFHGVGGAGGAPFAAAVSSRASSS